MAQVIQNSYSGGEISPSLYGRSDLGKWHDGASTMRNFFGNYRGGASSRAGLAYVGMCKQPGTSAPPRDIRFQYSVNQGFALEFGDQYMRIKSKGAYVVEAAQSITAVTNANPGVFTYNNGSYTLANGDWIYILGAGGMTSFNGLTWVVYNVSGTTFSLKDLFGNPIDTTTFAAYTGGGTLARIYTVVAPYAAVDLPYLKFAQSANTMSLCCVNQDTGTEYAPYDLVRNSNTNWVFTQTSFGSGTTAPTINSGTAQSSTTKIMTYAYVVTAVNADTGEESIASNPVYIFNNDISINAGSNSLSWSAVANAGSYNIYKCTPSYGSSSVNPPVGVSFGFVGTALGTSFIDTNITADFTQVPPVHSNPFARSAIDQVNISSGGSGYSQTTVGYAISTTTGSGFVGVPIVYAGAVTGFLIENPGQGYSNSDTITITGGSGATATLTIGPATGTYPGVVAYFQQRRIYGATLNDPDTYFASQPGSYTNMDSSIPVTDSDAFSGAPWAQQVNGIQFMQPMTNGLIILSGSSAWNLNGGNQAALTASSQTATSQAYNGCNPRVPPIVVDYDILYVQSKGSIVRDLSYNFFVNIFTGTDKTVLSNHLFSYHQIIQWAYAEEPYKLIWVIRDDGVMLSFTYLKEQDVYTWARHDTNGFFVGVCTVTEPPVDATYVIVSRYIQGQWVYYSERMDNRNWQNAEDSFCVDAGLSYPRIFPAATLTPAAVTGTQNITSINLIDGGKNYTSPSVAAVDPTGQGTGATFSATVVAGVITGINIITQGSNYQIGTKLQISDATGTKAVAQPIITNIVDFTTNNAVFNSGQVGNVIRLGNNNAALTGNPATGVTTTGGGRAVITAYISSTHVQANIIEEITSIIPNDPSNQPAPAVAGQWSIAVPTQTVHGLNHLEGKEVAILADGNVIPNQPVVNGKINLPLPYSAITVGLPYLCQLQSLYLEPPNTGTIQGKRKTITSVVTRLENSRGISVGTNQPDQSTQPDNSSPEWTNMYELKERGLNVAAGAAIPLFTGDVYSNVSSGWSLYGQVAFEQSYPLPANILGHVAFYTIGDDDGKPG